MNAFIERLELHHPARLWDAPQWRLQKAICGGRMATRFYGSDGETHYEMEWDFSMQQPRGNHNGISGWAKVLRSSGSSPSAAHFGRVHLCSVKPCAADFPASKYRTPPPWHLQPSAWRPAASAVAEAAAAPEAEPGSLPHPPERDGPAGAMGRVAGPPECDGPATAVAVAAGTPEGDGEGKGEGDGEASSTSSASTSSDGEEEGEAPPRSPSPGPALPPPPAAPPYTADALPAVPASAALQPRQPAPPQPSATGTPQLPRTAGTAAAGRSEGAAGSSEAAAGSSEVAATALSPAHAEAKVLRALLSVARGIRRPREYVGYSFFACLALARECRPCAWEGSQRVDLVADYAPWAVPLCTGACAVDAVCCCMVPAVAGGHASMVQVCEACPLQDCSHFVAAAPMGGGAVVDGGHEIEGFYSALGVAVLGTVMDGDCGIDVACQMLSLPQTASRRAALREEISDYLIARVQEPWMQDLMAALQEINTDDVKLSRSGGEAPMAGREGQLAEPPAAPADEGALSRSGGEGPKLDAKGHSLTLKAIAWATGFDDHALLESLAASLPPAVCGEQVVLHAAASAGKKRAAPEPVQLVVQPHALASRMQVARAFDERLRAGGWSPGSRVPRSATPSFATSLMWPSSEAAPSRLRCHKIRSWHAEWQREATLREPKLRPVEKRASSAMKLKGFAQRHRQQGAGRAFSVPFARQELYDWFVRLRYSIDWKACVSQLRSRGMQKCMGRFTRALLRSKLQQLQHDYCHACLVHGVRPTTVKPTARWFAGWESEYGVSMRKPNRKYKVPKAVMAERLEIGWCNVARVRALCLEAHGYDPELENWDQSPFHNNESGSANVGTLAVAGAIVPLVEGHSDTRERWTGNFTTFSNKARLMEQGPPYCEFVFKADGKIMELRLREYIRSRGFGPWVSVATAPKGSYRLNDVLNFLETHLPSMTESRQWRIIMADDFSPHLSPHVVRLCWSRGYVFIPHGGGVTPVAQTVDTDLNQHAKRDYIAAETAEFLRQMRSGVCVPRCIPEQCIDIGVAVLSNMSLHVHAADGYLKTGMTVSLDGSQDILIVREAGDFWKDLDMRQKINSAVAEVRAEARAGRLRWTFDNVQRLIKPFPKHKRVDAILAKLAEDTSLPEDEMKWVAEEGDDGDDGRSGGEEEEPTEGEDEDIWAAFAAEGAEEIEGAKEVEDAERRSGASAGGGGSCSDVVVDAAQAEELAASAKRVATLEAAATTLKECGLIKAAVNVENEIRKARRHARSVGSEDSQVLLALARQRELEEAQERQRRRLVDEANARTLNVASLRREAAVAADKLRKRKQAIQDAESLLETKHAMKSFSLEDLGQGRSRGGGGPAKKRRAEVLDRLARLGTGLSPAQRNDFAWWKAAWDEKMLAEHKEDWGGVFAGWVQRILNDLDEGNASAFSLFVHAETARCLSGAPALQL